VSMKKGENLRGEDKELQPKGRDYIQTQRTSLKLVKRSSCLLGRKEVSWGDGGNILKTLLTGMGKLGKDGVGPEVRVGLQVDRRTWLSEI